MLISSQPTVFKGVISTSNPYEGGGVVPPLDSLFAHLWIQCKTKVYILSLNSKRILFGLVHFHRFLNQYSGIQKSQKTLIWTYFFESATAIVSLRWTNFYVIFFRSPILKQQCISYEIFKYSRVLKMSRKYLLS